MYYVDTLVLECGRMCNMQCAHCLRGESQNCSLDIESAKRLIDQFDGISNITFTGGEPTLYTDFICEVVDYIISNEKPVFGFYVASNGKVIDYRLLCKLAELYGYVEEKCCEAEYTCRFDVSDDHYHDEINQRNKNLLKAFAFAGFRGDMTDRQLIHEGRAQENGIGTRILDIKDFSCDGECIEMVYLNAKGYLIPDCDYSYETQEEFKKYHIATPNVIENLFKEHQFI